ncbi:MAG: ATP-binding protein [Deltaproteobacteria bacterium]|nr:MAG: ATP-binding protein [Deltaproteobacteria bacterium]
MPHDHLPAWARRVAARCLTRTVSTFVLHGNVRDLHPVRGRDGKTRYVPLRTFLADALFRDRDLVIFYDRSSGIRADTKRQQQDLLRAADAYDALHGTQFSSAMPRDPRRALHLLESYIRLRASDGKRIALVIDFAETVVPANDVGHMGAEDRYALVTLQKWSHDPQLLASNVSICLVAENLSELSPKLTKSPYVSSVEIPLPDTAERRRFIGDRLGEALRSEESDLNEESLAALTAGLSRLQLGRLLTEAGDQGQPLTAEFVKVRKKEVLQAEAHGLLEVVEPAYTLDHVAGHEAVKRRLRLASEALRSGRLEVLPMGYLLCGPVGTGKTFLATCFAGEVGIPCVKLRNFRSQWQGVTEANLEKIFALLKAMWPVVVLVDEADAMLGDRDARGDSGVSQRVFGALASFMGNTRYRGKIVWFLLTARPDLLPVDLKRQGRAEEHLALFYPEGPEETDALFRALVRKTGIETEVESIHAYCPPGQRLSGADIEAVLTRARFRAAAERRERVTEDDLAQAFGDFIPPSYPLEIELQNLVAVQESTSRELLPEAWRNTPREELSRRIREIKVLLDG